MKIIITDLETKEEKIFRSQKSANYWLIWNLQEYVLTIGFVSPINGLIKTECKKATSLPAFIKDRSIVIFKLSSGKGWSITYE